MLNLFDKPYEKETLEDWAKLSIDIARVAILAVPVILYREDPMNIKIFNSIVLGVAFYVGLYSGRKFRKMTKEL
ncbi:hypothetical protein [Lonepinella sp. BR2271]|uniref:hypothetical protein n=1 Tax=Lonepinella sp. BR2271 TaxID=3434550 RepID=UPI003F6E259A